MNITRGEFFFILQEDVPIFLYIILYIIIFIYYYWHSVSIIFTHKIQVHSKLHIIGVQLWNDDQVEWIVTDVAFLFCRVLRVHLVHQETKDTQDLL